MLNKLSDKIDWFALEIAILCAIAYIYPVITATYVDSHINHVLYGTRNYWMGYWVAIGFVFPLFFAYMFNANSNISFFSKITYSARQKSLLTFLSLYIPIIIVLCLNFGPEYPQLAIATNSLGYGLVIATVVYVHNHRFEYINSETISEHIKIEKITAEHKTWLNVSIGLLVAFILFCLLMYNAFLTLPNQYTNAPQERVLLFNSFVVDLFVGILFSIFAFFEFFKKMQFIKYMLIEAQESNVAGKPQIFIAYASEDVEAARRLYRDLRKAGADPWINEESILPGLNWISAIENAIQNSRFFVAVLSNIAIQKRGHVQREIAKALEVYKEFPEYEIFIIPVKIEKCNPPDRLSQLEWVEMFPNWETGLSKILGSIFSQKAMQSKAKIVQNPPN